MKSEQQIPEKPFRVSLIYTLRIVLFSICFCLLQTASAQKKYDPVLEFAKEQISQKYYQPALSTINSYLESHKNDTVALYWKAYCFYKLKNYAAANETYTLLLKLHPKCYPAYVDVANMLVAEKKFNDALPFYNKAVSMNDSDVNLINSRGMCYYYSDKFELAIKDFRRVIKLDPNNYLAYNNMGSATYNNQNIAEASIVDLKAAELHFNKALEIKPDFQLANRNRGIVRYHLDKLDLAYKDLLYAIQLDPDDESAQYYLGKLLYKQKNYTVAIQFFDNAVNLANYKYEYYVDRGLCKLELENFKNARSDLYKALQLTKEKGYIYYQMARTYAAEGEKYSTFSNLRDAKKYGLFNDVRYFTYLTKDKYFVGWAKDNEFIDLINELKFGRK